MHLCIYIMRPHHTLQKHPHLALRLWMFAIVLFLKSLFACLGPLVHHEQDEKNGKNCSPSV